MYDIRNDVTLQVYFNKNLIFAVEKLAMDTISWVWYTGLVKTVIFKVVMTETVQQI